jgi:hypothetical protein
MSKSNLKIFVTKKRPFTVTSILCATTFLFLSSASAIDYPAKMTPSPASVKINTHETFIQNNVLLLKLNTSKDSLKLAEITDKCSDSTLKNHDGEFFTITLDQNLLIACSKMRLQGKLTSQQVSAIPDSPNLAERYPGKKLQAQLVSKNENLLIDWSLLLRDDSNYIRQIIDIKPTDTEIIIRSISFNDFQGTNAKVLGSVKGSPIVAGNMFFAYEHPNADNHIVESDSSKNPSPGKFICQLDRNTLLKPPHSLTQSSVIGVAPTSQLRRAFLYYIERERIRPYRPFLHYNSWYDIAWPERDKMNEAECVKVINGFGEELINKRKTKMDSFVFDDGWDDPSTLWQILQNNFPNGFTPLVESAQKYNSKIGLWLSPWGGYGKAKQDRLRYGKTQGFETNKAGFSLAGKNYLNRFSQSCFTFVDNYSVNFFKFDGTDASLLEETESLFRLTDELYAKNEDIFISLTVGTWASPFWLFHGDSVWRNGHDMSFSGKGSKRQQWLTYRDMETYRNVVLKGPLYPLNSLMNQGIVHAKWGPAKFNSNPNDFAQEVQSFFAIGTNLQELYMSYDRMTPQMWDILAQSAQWSRQNSDILVDTHWIGGDPGQLQVYGCASWQKRKGIIMLRNPNDKTQSISLDIASTFELPSNAPKKYQMKNPFQPQPQKTLNLSASVPHTFTLSPFEVLVLEAAPLTK